MTGHARKIEMSPWGLPASLLFHALLIVAMLLSPAATKLLPVEPDASVAVDILTSQQFQAIVEPPVPPAAQPPPAGEGIPGSQSVPESESGMVVARTMLSEKTLSDPRSRQARRDLATFSDGERIVQLCNLEAMDQVAAWQANFRPDRLVAYARSEVKMSGETMVADGAAFRSRGRWYDITFRCEVGPDHVKVVAFEFKVGDPVPRRDWENLNLPTVN